MELVSTGSFFTQIFDFKILENNKMTKMNTLVLLMGLCMSTLSQANFGLIQDSDGHVNVREQASVQAKILGKLNNGEVVSWLEDDESANRFRFISASFPQQAGYVHDSRINPFQGFQKWSLKQSDASSAGYVLGQNHIRFKAQKAQFKAQDFKLAGQTQGASLYRNKPFWGTDGELPTGQLQLAQIDVNFNGQKIAIPAQDLQAYFIPVTPMSAGGLQDFAEAEIYSKGTDLYILNTLASGGAAQYTLMIHIQNGKVVKIQAWQDII